MSACGGSPPGTVAASASSASEAESASNAAHSDEFLGARDALLKYEDPSAAAEAARWMLSDPIDITAPGEYVLKAGPLPTDADADAEVAGSLSPVDTAEFIDMRWVRGLREGIDVGPRIVEENGRRFAVLPLTVSKVITEYLGYRAWIEWRPVPRITHPGGQR
jgi:hypothetical protein